jgi:biotin carboxyl carrier protein
MKMETTIASNYNGKVKAIFLSEGEMVQQDDLIVELE